MADRLSLAGRLPCVLQRSGCVADPVVVFLCSKDVIFIILFGELFLLFHVRTMLNEKEKKKIPQTTATGANIFFCRCLVPHLVPVPSNKKMNGRRERVCREEEKWSDG